MIKMTGIVSSSYYEKINENSRFFACAEVFVREQMICEPNLLNLAPRGVHYWFLGFGREIK